MSSPQYINSVNLKTELLSYGAALNRTVCGRDGMGVEATDQDRESRIMKSPPFSSWMIRKGNMHSLLHYHEQYRPRVGVSDSDFHSSIERTNERYSCLCSAAVEHLIVCRDRCDLTPNRRGDGAVQCGYTVAAKTLWVRNVRVWCEDQDMEMGKNGSPKDMHTFGASPRKPPVFENSKMLKTTHDVKGIQ